jgi:hypothetical protein
VANISSSLTSYVLGLLTSDTGLTVQLLAIAQDDGIEAPPTVRSVTIQNAAPDMLEKSSQAKYPAALVYCEKLTNKLREKFRTFSGQAKLAIELRCSQDRLHGIESHLELYADAACKVLDNARGDWQDGAFYTGGYEVSYSPVRQGGKGFLQIAKISFDVEVSR